MRPVVERECKRHGLVKFRERTDRKHKDGRRFVCTRCEYAALSRRRAALKAKLVKYFGGKCIRCGYAKSLRALSFHHRDPSQKEFTLSDGVVLSWGRMVAEAEKCDLLCANCHAEVEDEAFYGV